MAEALLQGVLNSKLLSAAEIMVSDISADRLEYLTKKYQVQTTSNNVQTLRTAENILLAVKPQVLDGVLEELRAVNRADRLIITIIAGVPMDKIDTQQNLRLARVMPNTPALIGLGASAVCFNARATEQDKTFTLKLLQSVGTVVEVEEKDINAVTGLSGSGPAFVFRLMDCFIKAGESLGLASGTAQALTYQTFLGSVCLAQKSEKSLEELIAQVTSPNGTTQAGREVLERSDIGQIIGDTIRRAKERADELAKGGI